MKDKVNILGIAGSLRSGFFNRNIDALPETQDGLMRFLNTCSKRGRCPNSELALIAGLWGAKQEGASIYAVTLSNYDNNGQFNGKKSGLDALVKEADGIFISSPVYFGAYSCLIYNFIDLLTRDPAYQSDLVGKIYSGIAVGAKRNGGQETTLIYQMADMLNLGFIGVGNNTSTTCQYGGTVVAGNKNAVIKDGLGIETSIGAGSRIARTARLYAAGKVHKLEKAPRFDFWILQDQNLITETLIQPLVDQLADNDIPSNCYRIYDYLLQPCKACDRCPSKKSDDATYQCRIDTPKDEFKVLHDFMLRTDVIVPTLFSPVDRTNLRSIYQRFLERTRYLRRSDYMLSDRVVIPLIFCEIGRNEYLDLRLISSLIRHNTIIHKPLIGMTFKGRLINPQKMVDDWNMAIKTCRCLVAGRYHLESHARRPQYIPLGY